MSSDHSRKVLRPFFFFLPLLTAVTLDGSNQQKQRNTVTVRGGTNFQGHFCRRVDSVAGTGSHILRTRAKHWCPFRASRTTTVPAEFPWNEPEDEREAWTNVLVHHIRCKIGSGIGFLFLFTPASTFHQNNLVLTRKHRDLVTAVYIYRYIYI